MLAADSNFHDIYQDPHNASITHLARYEPAGVAQSGAAVYGDVNLYRIAAKRALLIEDFYGVDERHMRSAAVRA